MSALILNMQILSRYLTKKWYRTDKKIKRAFDFFKLTYTKLGSAEDCVVTWFRFLKLWMTFMMEKSHLHYVAYITISSAATIRFKLCIAAKLLHVKTYWQPIKMIVVALSNGTIADPLRPTIQPQYRTFCIAEWSSKVNDIHFIWRGLCDFLQCWSSHG